MWMQPPCWTRPDLVSGPFFGAMTQDAAQALTLSRQIETAERAVWASLSAGDEQADRAALAPDFLGVYPDGFADRNDHAAQMADGPTVAAFTLSDIQVRPLGPDHALISYRADYARQPAAEPEAMYVSSIWRRTGDGRRNIFSQDTPAAPAGAAPPGPPGPARP
ncbi:MAG: nuclear transport factor 2 family protein [Pseudomonadota bacterium]